MAISDEQIEEIRTKIDIADLVTSYGFQLKHRGSDLWCCCPFHQEKTPSFKVDSIRGMYHCFGCGESGDVFSFVMKQEGLNFNEALHKLAEIANVELKSYVNPNAKLRDRLYELMASLAIDFNKMLRSRKNTEGEVAREYLKKRQLDEAAVNQFLIGYAPKDVDRILMWAQKHGYSYKDLADAGIIKLSDSPERKPYFYFANRLVFTVKDKNGRVVAFSGRQLIEDKKSGKYINSPETIIFKKSRTFFAFDEARKHIVKAPNREAIVCEGQVDCIRLHSNGFNTAVAPLGTAFTQEHAVQLHRVADTALLCFDDDEAGHKATIKTAQLLLAEGMPIRVVSLPDGDDPDSYILRCGARSFGELIRDKSESIVKFQMRVESAKEVESTDPNALVRITKAVLETIAKSSDAVLRDVLLKDAAQSLGVDYSNLQKELEKHIQSTAISVEGEKEQLIEPYIAGNASDINKPPTIAESALINFIYTNEDAKEIKEYVSRLIPDIILYSPLSKRLVEAWVAGTTNDGDAIQCTVESLSTEEYRTFLSIVVNLDPMDFAEISTKNKIVYFARQIWHDYLVRLLTKEEQDSPKKKKVLEALKKLHLSTIKGVVHLITTFPFNDFKS